MTVLALLPVTLITTLGLPPTPPGTLSPAERMPINWSSAFPATNQIFAQSQLTAHDKVASTHC